MREPYLTRRQGSRDHILQAAGEVFLDTGFARSSIDRIAATARVSKQSIYDQFVNKEALFEAAVRRTIQESGNDLAAIRPANDIAHTLAEYGRLLFDAFGSPENFGLFRANIVAATHFPKLAAELHEYRLAMSQSVGDYLQRRQAEKQLKIFDARLAAQRFGAMAVQGSRYFLGASMPEANAQQACVEAAVELFLHGYRRPIADIRDDHEQPVAAPLLEASAALRLSSDKFARLMAAAMAEFRDRGYVGTSIERVAKEVGSSKATIYRHFGSKEGLFRYLIECDIHGVSCFEYDVPAGKGVDDAIATLALQALERHIAPASISLNRMLIEESPFLPDLSRRYFDACVGALGRALHHLLAERGWPAPNRQTQSAFYTLATFGVRFLTVQHLPDAAARQKLSWECGQMFLHGYARNTS